MQTTKSAQTIEEETLIKDTTNNLDRLNLSKAWLADQMGISAEYLRKILTRAMAMSKIVRESLRAFNKKLEQMAEILKAA